MSETVNSPAKLSVLLLDLSFDETEEANIKSLYARLKAEPDLYLHTAPTTLSVEKTWRNKLDSVTRLSRIIVICLSPFSSSQGASIEPVLQSIYRYTRPINLAIVLVKLSPCETPPSLKEWSVIDYFEDAGYQRLLEVFKARAEYLGLIPPSESASTQSQTALVPPSVALPYVPQVLLTKSNGHEAEREQLLQELQNLNTTPERRLKIGERLNSLKDTRPGVGVYMDGTSDMIWLPVTPGGELIIKHKTYQIKPFFIARYLVTYAQYVAFEEAKDGYQNPAWWQGLPKPALKQFVKDKVPSSWVSPINNKPINKVSLYQSIAFTRWLNQRLQGLALSFEGGSTLTVGQNAQIRLPLHEEWQWAYQGGPENRRYPWGEWQYDYANTREIALWEATSVGMFPQGAALSGAEDMCGNAREWCLAIYPGYKGGEARGGNQYSGAKDSKLRDGFGGTHTSSGFRVVVSFPVKPFYS